MSTHAIENGVSEDTPDGPVGEEEVDIGFKDLQGSGASNIYVLKRNFIHQLMDVALLMANVSQLKALLSLDSDDKYYYLLLTFICLSISLQVVFTMCMLVIWSIEKNLESSANTAVNSTDKSSNITIRTLTPAEEEGKKNMAECLDKVGNVLVLMIIVANVFITGFGVEPHSETEPVPQQPHLNKTV